MGAMEDTTVVILLIAAAISITLSVIVCEADLGASCPRKPLWGGPVKLPSHDDAGADCSGTASCHLCRLRAVPSDGVEGAEECVCVCVCVCERACI